MGFLSVTFFVLLAVVNLVVSKPLRICHTNDFHAKYLEVGDSNVKCQWWDIVEDNCYSGIDRLKGAFEMLNCDITVQAGDWVQGSLLDTVYQQQVAIDTYRMINYDFATFGNHEFDYGNEHINDTIRAIAPTTTWLSSNVFFDGQGMEDLPLFRYVDRHDICWVSCLTKETLDLSAVEDNVRIEDEESFMVENIKKCKQQRNVIAITHQGFNNDLETCMNVKEIDLIIGGHSHTNLDNGEYPVKVVREDGSVCWVTTAYAHGRYIGALDVEFDDEGNISFRTTQYLAVDYRVQRNLDALYKIRLYDDQVSLKAEEQIGTATEDVDGGQLCRGPEDVPSDGTTVMADCGMGDLVCDAVLANAGTNSEGLEQTCIMNGGTMRNSFLEGPITLRDLINVLPFGNTIASMKLKGSEILDALNYGFSLTATDNRGGFPGGVGNMKLVTAVDGSKPEGEMVTIVSASIGGKALDPEKMYLLFTNSYMAGGGDGYPFTTEYVDWGTLVRDTVQTYLGVHDPFTPVSETSPRIEMSGTSTEALNEKMSTMNSAETDSAAAYVYDEKLAVETELDQKLAQPPKVTKKKLKTCSGSTCKA